MFGGLQQGLRYKEGLQNNYDNPNPTSDSDPVQGADSSPAGTSLRPLGNEPVNDNSSAQTSQGKKCQDNILKDLTTFNNLLQQYNTVMKTINDDVVKNKGAANSHLIGSNIIVNDKNSKDVYYINKFGYPQKYESKGSNSFSNRGPNCHKDTTPTSITSAQWANFKDMKGKGPEIFNNNSCGLEGDILSDGSGNFGYVDIMSHPVSLGDAAAYNKIQDSTCKGIAKSIGSNFADIFNKSAEKYNGGACLRMAADTESLNKLKSLNDSLLTLIKSIETENECLQKLESSNNKQIQDNLKNIASIKKKLSEDSQSFSDLKSGKSAPYSNDGVNLNLDLLESTGQSALSNSELFVNMNYMRYIIGFVIVCVIGYFTLRYWSSDKQPLFVTLLSIALVVYIIWIYFLSRIHIKFK